MRTSHAIRPPRLRWRGGVRLACWPHDRHPYIRIPAGFIVMLFNPTCVPGQEDALCSAVTHVPVPYVDGDSLPGPGPGPEVVSEDEWPGYAWHYQSTPYHLIETAPMGPVSTPGRIPEW
jgi:hypothetical protein